MLDLILSTAAYLESRGPVARGCVGRVCEERRNCRLVHGLSAEGNLIKLLLKAGMEAWQIIQE